MTDIELLGDFATAEIMEKYGDVPLKFVGYYKYSFGFGGVAPDGALIVISVGGNSDEIYRYHVLPESIETLKGHNWHSADVKLNGQTIFTKYEY